MATTTPIRDVHGHTALFSIDRSITIAVADALPSLPMPKCRVIWAEAGVMTLGTGTGGTTITLANATGNVDITSVSILVASGVAGLAVVGTLAAAEASLLFAEGDKLNLNIDAVPGTTVSTFAFAHVLVELL
jgi:hypothetical protein